MLATISSLLALCVLCNTSSAQTDPAQAKVHDKSLKTYKLPPNLKKHLQEKYKDQIKEVTSNIQETPQGPRGTLGIMGNIKPKNAEMITKLKNDEATIRPRKIESVSGAKADHARAIADAFLIDEADLLGLPDLKELREYKISTDMGHDGEYTEIYYTRYIDDLPLDKTYLHIEIGPDESIMYVNATLIPAPPQLYEAVTRKTVTEEEARSIIEKDLMSKKVEAANLVIDIKKYAISSSPYVVWKVAANAKRGRGKWEYVLDALTGRVISNLDKSSRGDE